MSIFTLGKTRKKGVQYTIIRQTNFFFLNSVIRFGQPGVDLHCHHDADVAVLQILFLINEVRFHKAVKK